MIALEFISRLLIGADRKLRLLWRAEIFFAHGYWMVLIALDPALGFVASRLHLAEGLTAANITLQETENFIVALICTGVFAWDERQRLDSYGLPAALAL